jgi:hypothetical protein
MAQVLRGAGVMLQFEAPKLDALMVDPWLKAAECERVIHVVADPERRTVLMSLRSLWIALGNERPCYDSSRETGELSQIAQIHAELMVQYKNAMH